MKICYIADARSIHIVHWLKYFVEKGYDVYLITDTENQIEGVKIHNIGDCLPKIQLPFLSATYQILTKTKKIRQLLKEIKPNILHAHYATNYGYLAAKTNFHPLILTCHGSDILLDIKKDWINKYFVKFTLKHSDYITAPSNQMAEIIRKITVKKSNLSILQYGIDTEQFKFKDKKITKNTTFLSTRSLIPKYKIDLILLAFEQLFKENPNIKLVIVGEGLYKTNLKKMTAELGIEKAVKFVGHIENSRIHEFYLNSHIYVTASPTDGLSISLLEAMSCGCYPILPDNESNKEIQNHGFHVGLYKVNKVESLYHQMKEILKKKDNLEGILRNNSILVENNYSRKVNLEKIENLYKEILGR